MKKLIAVVTIAVLVTAFGTGCFNDSSVDPGPRDGIATVSGTVYGYHGCAFCTKTEVVDPYPGPGQPYKEMTGRDATVSFIDESSNAVTILTDDASAYVTELPVGTYTVKVDTWHSWPISITDVEIRRDTTVESSIYLSIIDPDTVLCVFTYLLETDTLGLAAEEEALTRLMYTTATSLLPDQARREIWIDPYIYDPPRFQVIRYYVPVQEGYRVWETCDACWQAMGRFPGYFPDAFHVEPVYDPFDYITTQ